MTQEGSALITTALKQNARHGDRTTHNRYYKERVVRMQYTHYMTAEPVKSAYLF